MAKYKLEMYGQEIETTGHSIKDENVIYPLTYISH